MDNPLLSGLYGTALESPVNKGKHATLLVSQLGSGVPKRAGQVLTPAKAILIAAEYKNLNPKLHTL